MMIAMRAFSLRKLLALVKGGHSGPGMNANAAATILMWIQAKHDALQ